MPTPAKPCDGRFSDEIQILLVHNKDRAQWATHPCEVCGALVGAVQVHSKWVPEQHWPTVKYPTRNPADKRRGNRDRSGAPREEVVLAGSGSPTD